MSKSTFYLPEFIVRGKVAPLSMSSVLVDSHQVCVESGEGERIRVLNQELEKNLSREIGNEIEAIGVKMIDEKKSICILIVKYRVISGSLAA